MADTTTDGGNRQEPLETRVAVLESTVRVEATARASMDKDLGELKITKNMPQQVLDASSDHHRRLRHLDKKTDNIELVVGHVNGGVQRLEGDMDSLHAHVNQLEISLTNRINRLEGSVNSRFARIDTRLGGVETRLEDVETKLTGLQTGVNAILDRLGPPPADANSGS